MKSANDETNHLYILAREKNIWRFNDYNVHPKNKNKPDAVELFSGIFYLRNIQLPEWNAPPDSNLAEKQKKKEVINNILKDICQKWFE